MTDTNLDETDPTGQQHEGNAAASQTETEMIAALKKQTEEQGALNSTLTQELENLRTQLKEREERDARRRKKLDPKNLAFDSPADETEGEGEEEKTPEQSETSSEPDDSPPRLRGKKHNTKRKDAQPINPIRFNLGDQIPSDITPKSLAEMLRQILSSQGESAPSDLIDDPNQPTKIAEQSTDVSPALPSSETKCDGADGSLVVDHFTFSSSIADYIRSASLVISHAGSGSIFETLKLGKPLIVVVNEDLMDNHQCELAEELQERKHLYCARPHTLHQALTNMELESLVRYTPGDGTPVARIIDRFLGFPDD